LTKHFVSFILSVTLRNNKKHINRATRAGCRLKGAVYAMNETYLTPEEAAEKYKVAAVTIRKWLRQGKLKGYKVGGTIWRIEEGELDAFVKGSINKASNQ